MWMIFSATHPSFFYNSEYKLKTKSVRVKLKLTMYVAIRNCPTATLRHEAELHGLCAKTRTQLLTQLSNIGIKLLELKQQEEEPLVQQEKVVTQYRGETEPVTVQRNVNYFPLIETPRRSGHLLTDAAFSVLDAQIVRGVHTLQVCDIDVIMEIEDIKKLKNQMVNDYTTLKTDLNHLKDTLESTLNQDLYVYRTANEIAWNNLEQHVHIPGGGVLYTVESPVFYGKVEDSVVHGNMHFEIHIQQNDRMRDRFTVDLPVAMDETMPLCPIMVLVNSNYDETTGEYLYESTTCHSYIQRDTPTTLVVFCPLLRDDFTRLQFDITLRYFARLQPTMLTPARMSSMWSSETSTERNHLAKHQWTILGDRVELFTNINIQIEMDEVDTIRVRLPVESSQFDTIGYGIIHYTIHGDNIIYSANTPMIRISASTDPYTLIIKSALLKAVNSYNTMQVSTHIVYSRKADTNLVYDFVIEPPTYAKKGDVVRVTFKTTTAVNAYYFMGLNAVNKETEESWPLVEHSVEGLQNNWNFDWTVPETIDQDVEVRFAFDLFEHEYVSSNSLIVPSVQLFVEKIHVELDHVGTNDVALWIRSIETTFDVPYSIRAQIDQTTKTVYNGFTKHTDKVWFQWTGLEENTAYTLYLIFTDPLGRETIKPVMWSSKKKKRVPWWRLNNDV